MKNSIRVSAFFLFLFAFLLAPLAAYGTVSIACTCTDTDCDGYGNPASIYCPHEELDCLDNPVDDPAVCATDTCASCGAPECAACAKCIHPGATEICDGLDNNCNDVVDEEPAASESCDNGVFCDGAEVCTAGACQPGDDPCDDGSACTEDSCDEDADTCENACLAVDWQDPCCDDPGCSAAPACEKEPVCGDGYIDPGEICGEPGLEDACPESAPICLNCVDCGIPVELLYFQAVVGNGSVTLIWETATEVDTAGFNILRSESEDGPFAKINDTLIPAKGGTTQGATYSYVDNGVQNGVTYWYQLEDVDVTGESEVRAPTLLVSAAGGWATDASAEAAQIGETGGASSLPFNSVAFFLVPIGAFLILRRRMKK